MRRVVLILLLCQFAITLNAQKKRSKLPPEGTYISDAQFKDFIPISPLEYEDVVTYYDKKKADFVTVPIKKLAADKSLIIQFLPNEVVYATVQKTESNGEIKIGTATVTAAAGSYIITLDYCKFTTLKVQTNDGKCEGYAKVGVGMRITARITTFDAGVDVSSLFSLGIAAKTGQLRGQISLDVIGMESSKITDLIVLPVDISDASIQTSLQSLSAIKSKIYDAETNLFPQIVSVKRSATDNCSVIDILKSIETKAASNLDADSESPNPQQQQLQGQQQQQQQQHQNP